MKKRYICIILIILFLVLILGAYYYFFNNRTYKLKLPEAEKIGSISLEQEENIKSIYENEKIQDVIYVLNGKTTKKESIQDTPINASNKIKIEFNFKEEGKSVIFVYEKNNEYYIEQPYNGIYRISPDEYNSIEKYIK